MQLQLAREPCLIEPGGAVHALTPRDGALLLWLALEGATPRARLAQLLWPDKDADAARNSLRQRLFQLHKRVGRELVGGSASLALVEGVTHDLHEADTLLAETPGEELAPGDFARWLEAQRELRRARVRSALVELADGAEAARDWHGALTHGRELLALEPLSEDAHRRVIRLHYLAGDRAAALLAFDACERVLKDEVGARPSAETLALLSLVQQGQAIATRVSASRAAPAGLLRPPRLIGRERELSALAAALDRGQVVFVVGEAGMGKTRLLDAWRESAPGWVYASARPGDASVPFTSIARVLREAAALSPTASPLAIEPAQRRALARLLPEIGDAASRSDGETFRGVLEEAVRSFLWARGAIRGLLLDDLHFADRSSLELLSALLAGGSDEPMPPCTLAFRPADAGSPVVALQDALLDRLHLETIALEPLSESALADLIDSLCLPGLSGSSLAPTMRRRTGGNPLFVLETLKQAWADGSLKDEGRALAAPASIGRLIERRLVQLTPGALALARVASLAGVDFDLALAEHVLGTTAMQLADAINELEAAQVMHGKAFAHDLVFESVRAGVPPAVAVHTHAKIALWLEGHAGEPARVAEHWLAADLPARAVDPLQDAARRASRRTAYAQATALAQRAAQLARSLGDERCEFEAWCELAEYTSYEDPGALADAALDRLDELARDELQQLRARSARWQQQRRRQAFPEPADLLHWLGVALRMGERQFAADWVVLGVGMYVALGQPDAGMALVEQHRALLDDRASNDDRAVLHETLAFALANLDRFDEALVWSLQCEAPQREAGDKVELMRTEVNRLRYFRSQGRHELALHRWEDIERWHAAEAPNPLSHATAGSGMAEALCDLEHFGDALTLIDRNLEMAARAAGRLYLSWPVARAKIWLALGQTARSLQALDAGEPGFAAAPAWLQARWLFFRALTEARLHGDRPDQVPAEALPWLDRAARSAPRDHRRLAWFECELQRAAWSAPADGAARAELVASLARQQGMIGHAQHAHWRAAERLLAEGRVDDARRQWQQAQALRRWRFASCDADEPVFPSGLSELECRWIELRLLHEARDPAAGERATAAVSHLRNLARSQVPAEFRDAFLHRHPVHRELLALAARLMAH